jgi:hypothetical protein
VCGANPRECRQGFQHYVRSGNWHDVETFIPQLTSCANSREG